MSSSRSNRLAEETSPYLLQHARNPVDWYPWGSEALDRSKREGKPIFLSIGYSACHWCHVMEHECFENASIAALMNDHFINIKVDREERPDLDQIYMTAVQALTGHGGWPMSVFLTPELQPFYGGTYFPPTDARGMPGFPRVLLSVHRAWEERRDDIIASAGELTERIQSMGEFARSDDPLSLALLDNAAKSLLQAFDPRNGGFGSAPKFPHPMDLRVLLRQYKRTGDARSLKAVQVTLDKMAAGGIYDHLGGGFARYSTDERWLVPHFEKMLYDNALLISTYLEAFQLTKTESFAGTARECVQYVLGRMTAPVEGAFYSTEDADSEGVEGKYYVWTLEELRGILGPERATIFGFVYDVTEHGNWEEHAILNLPRSIAESAKALGQSEESLLADLKQDRAKLLEARDGRIPPLKDTKVLTSWNGLMIAALDEAGRILKEASYIAAAEKAAGFFAETMWKPGGPLIHVYREGVAKLDGYLDDYANLIDGLTRLFEASGTPRWILLAIELADVMIRDFADPELGGFFYTGNNHETLIARQKDAFDNATPSGNAMAATALLRLAAITGRADFQKAGEATLQAIRTLLDKAPTAVGQSLIALDFLLAKPLEFALLAESEIEQLDGSLEALAGLFLPNKVVAPATASSALELGATIGLLRGRASIQGEITTYVCEGHACQSPLVGVDALTRRLGEV